jgi:hypothetical protein
MIIRYYISCATCHTSITLRVGIGRDTKQAHSFNCPNCREIIKVDLDVNQIKPSIKFYYIENCNINDTEGIIINLHPDYLVAESDLHNPTYSSISEFSNITQKHERHLEKYGKRLKDFALSSDELRTIHQNIKPVNENWKIIQKAWSLSVNRQDKLAENYTTKYADYNFTSTANLKEVLFHFFDMLTYPKGRPMFLNAMQKIDIAIEFNRSEFEKFRSFFISGLFSHHYELFFNKFSDYFENLTDYEQTLQYACWDVDITGKTASSISFKKTRMFYGNIYEAITSIFVVLGCLKNILSGRAFDEFEIHEKKKKVIKKGLHNYHSLSKYYCALYLNDIPEFNALIQYLNNDIRNSSHHEKMVI